MEISIDSVVDRRPLGEYRIGIIAICFLIVLMDGFDTQVIGFVAGAIARTRGIPVADFGRLFSAGLLGSALGAFILGPLGDRVGRRRMLILSVLIFSAFSFSFPHLTRFPQLLACRFLTGLGLGGALPNLLALCAEFTPREMRGATTGILFAGFPAGGATGALVSAHVVPAFGWPTIFYIGGSVPLILVLLAIFILPSSLRSALKHRDGQQRVAAIVRRMAPMTVPPEPVVYIDTGTAHENLSLRQALRTGGVFPTLMLWCSSVMCFVVLIVMGLWTAVLLHEQGVDAATAATMAGLFNLGSVVGTALGGKLLDRLRPLVVLPAMFVAGAICVSLVGQVSGSVLALAAFTMLAGAFVGAGSAQLLGLAVLIYPSAIRASGVGWVVATGRTGQVLGPLAVGALLGHKLPVHRIFLCEALPAVCAAVSVFLLCRSRAVAQSIAWRERSVTPGSPRSTEATR
jgi:AAHS family 4-hydroxybenzoate transporter-like MFS transporter